MDEPGCLMAHQLLNKLSVIIGNTELVHEQTQPDSECARRLLTIKKAAEEMTTELRKHQCELTSFLQFVDAHPLVT